MHASDGYRKIVTARAGHQEAVPLLVDEFGGCVVFSADEDDRSAFRERLDHDETVALPPRGEDEAERTRERILDHLLVYETRRLDHALEPVLGDRSQHLRSFGAVAVDRAAEVRDRLPRLRDCVYDGHRVLLPDVASREDDDGLGRQGRRRPARPRTAPRAR